MNELNWDDLRILLAVAETGSLSAAATRLRLSQPTVGRRLRALERSLDLRIIHKVSNRIELTAAGERIIAEAHAMTTAAKSVTDAARLAAGLDHDPVQITATGSVSLFITDHLAELRPLIGDIAVALTASRERVQLQRRDADIALRMRRLPTDGNLLARKIARVAFSIYGSKRDAQKSPLIGQPTDELPSGTRRLSQSSFFDDWAADRPIDWRIADVGQRYRAICAGGIGLLPCWLGDTTPGLTRLIAPPPVLQEDLYLLIHQNLKTDRRIKSVAAGLVRITKTHAALLAGRPE